jgi:sugar phosphate isomerase/epimerase
MGPKSLAGRQCYTPCFIPSGGGTTRLAGGAGDGYSPASRTRRAGPCMLLTLTATSLRPMLEKKRSGKVELRLADLPAYARETLGLHGINLTTGQLAGIDRSGLEKLRDRADKAGCACLLLIEQEPQPLGDPAEAKAAAAYDRLRAVLQAAQILGCAAIAMTPTGPDNEETVLRTAERLRKLMGPAERFEINLLISPAKGLTSTPEKVTEIIKKVGGFRVGTFPDFQAAAASPDPVQYLRRLTPYATVVSASSVQFVAPGGDAPGSEADAPVEHKPYDLRPLVEAVDAVGFDGTLAIDYRGKGDPTLGVIRTRRLLETIIRGEEPAAEPDEDEEGPPSPEEEAEIP